MKKPDYARAIRVARAVRQMEQRELAAKAKVDASYISLIEVGKRQPSGNTLHKITTALKTTPALLALIAQADPLTASEFESIGRFVKGGA